MECAKKERKKCGTWAREAAVLYSDRKEEKRALAKATGTVAKDKKTKNEKPEEEKGGRRAGVRVESGEEREKKQIERKEQPFSFACLSVDFCELLIL